MTEVVIAAITALTGTTAFQFYTRLSRQRVEEREALISELREWRDDWKARALELDKKVQQLCVENGLLRAQIEKLENQIKTLQK